MNFSSTRHRRAIWLFGALIFVAAVFLVVGIKSERSLAKSKPKTAIKFATLAPEGSTWMKLMRKFDKELRGRTENRVGFKFYPGGVQGDEMDVLRKIRNGLAVNRSGFHYLLKEEFKLYIELLSNPSNEKLRLNFKKKMDHIAQA